MDSPKVRNKKQVMFAVGVVSALIFLLMFGMWISDPNKGKPSALEVAKEKAQEVKKGFTASSRAVVNAEESWIAKSETELEVIKQENKTLKDALTEMNLRLSRMEDGTGLPSQGNKALPNFGSPSDSKAAQMPPSPSDVNSSPAFSGEQAQQPVNNRSLPPPPANYGAVPPPQQNQNGEPVSSIQVVDLSGDDPIDGENVPLNINSTVPLGSWATIALITGVDAPTGGRAKSDPLPVMLRFLDFGNLPNGFKSEIKDCHAIGAAYGEISSERTHIRLEGLACVTNTGEVLEAKVSGYVNGEDGKAGFRGTLVTKEGALIARSAVAGVLGGMGQSIAQQYTQVQSSALGTVSTVDSNKVFESGLATGASNSLEKIADFYIARANELYPIIETDGGRIGEVVFTQTFTFDTDFIGKMGGNG